MPKKKTPSKRRRTTRSSVSRTTKLIKRRKAKPTLKERLARAKRLEKLDAGKPTFKIPRQTLTSHPYRNENFPDTYIREISVSLDDPDHWLTLTWAGPNAESQEMGPFRTSPGAGLVGLNCDNEATSRRSGSKCTPKGTYPVQGFQYQLNSDPRAKYVTWFMQRRGIALHYFPNVPEYAASHGCVRIESTRVARLIRDNSLIDETQVVVSGTWTKPPKQWD
jgi:L,D-transpeptidase catalytic domain